MSSRNFILGPCPPGDLALVVNDGQLAMFAATISGANMINR